MQKDGLLLVGINPSFDESFEGPCKGEVHDSENGGYQHPYFTKPKKLNEEIGIKFFACGCVLCQVAPSACGSRYCQ